MVVKSKTGYIIILRTIRENIYPIHNLFNSPELNQFFEIGLMNTYGILCQLFHQRICTSIFL